MHSEHLQNVTVGRVVGAWLVAIAVTSLVMLVMTSLGLPTVEGETSWWSLAAVAIGFFVGGMFSGMRALQAPVLHGIAIGLTSLVAWVLINAFVYGVVANDARAVHIETALTPALTVALLLVQIVAAVLGALIGYNIALRGKPGLSEHEPVV
jgi:hypothetical protein